MHYPNADDAAAGLADGRLSAGQRDAIDRALAAGIKPPQRTSLGGEILVHGGGGDRDWTLGCVALDDADIDALRARLPADMTTDILILP